MDISTLNIVIWIWKLTFQFWKFLFKFKKIIWSKNWYLNSKLLFLNLKIIISILKTLLTLKIGNLILNIFISTWNLIFEFEVKNLNFKKSFDLKVEIGIPNYYFGFSELIFQFRKLLIKSSNANFNFEYYYLNLKINISILKFLI
jgi:hypothetical protein